MALKRSTFVAAAVISAVILTYTVAVRRVFLDRHLTIAPGNYREIQPEGYRSVNYVKYQIPEVFRGKHLTIRDTGDGKMCVLDDSGNSLLLTQGADGLYFSQDFDPIGPRIFPGLARNWNEGRIHRSGNSVFVEGYMLEKGLMLFVVPFKDVIEWRLELRNGAEPDEPPD
jgi:hypothetical protein